MRLMKKQYNNLYRSRQGKTWIKRCSWYVSLFLRFIWVRRASIGIEAVRACGMPSLGAESAVMDMSADGRIAIRVGRCYIPFVFASDLRDIFIIWYRTSDECGGERMHSPVLMCPRTTAAWRNYHPGVLRRRISQSHKPAVQEWPGGLSRSENKLFRGFLQPHIRFFDLQMREWMR